MIINISLNNNNVSDIRDLAVEVCDIENFASTDRKYDATEKFDEMVKSTKVLKFGFGTIIKTGSDITIDINDRFFHKFTMLLIKSMNILVPFAASIKALVTSTLMYDIASDMELIKDESKEEESKEETNVEEVNTTTTESVNE